MEFVGNPGLDINAAVPHILCAVEVGVSVASS
jgi:hypothetical protein